MRQTALTIAGSDSGGGAGIQADLKTFAALGVYGMSVITALTAQNTCGVRSVREMDCAIIEEQLAAIYEDIPVGAVKIGMLSNEDIITTIANGLQRYQETKIVLDTVMISKHGHHLLKPEAVSALQNKLLPLALVVTPNLHEATQLVGFPVEERSSMERAAKVLHAMGARYVVVKGGHLPGEACDLLYDGERMRVFSNERIDNAHTHGTGCTFSSAIAAALAKGCNVEEAVAVAKRYVTMAITHGGPLGKGIGPTHHFYELYQQAGLEE